jgi:hypothetical protein
MRCELRGDKDAAWNGAIEGLSQVKPRREGHVGCGSILLLCLLHYVRRPEVLR